MTTGYILIAAILILGGAIATVGDRIGTRVGKARLSLFNLRPRNTAVVVTILTGGIIAGSTLAILFAADDRLRTGVFELEEIQNDLKTKRDQLKNTRQQLQTTNTQKLRVESELAQARNEQKAEQIAAQQRQAEAEKRLQEINQSLQAAITKQSQTQTQLNRTQAQQAQTQNQLNRTQAEKASTEAEKASTEAQLNKTQSELKSVSQQATTLRLEIKQLQTERQQLVEQRNQVKAEIAKLKTKIARRDQEIAALDSTVDQRDRDIAERDRVIQERETRLKELETQQEYLEREVAKLEQYYQSYQALRLGNLAVFRGQVLASGVVRIVEPQGAKEAVEQLLREANRNTIKLTQPGTNQVNEQVVQITEAQVDQLINQIDDGQDYVVRILSAGNYVRGEKRIEVFTDAARNRVVFFEGEVVAATSANPTTMTAEEIQQRINLLLLASQFRARNAGILGDTIQIVGDGRLDTLIRFFEQLKQYNQPLDIKAVAAEPTYTAGPLKLELVAVKNGQVVFQTKTVGGERGAFETPAPSPAEPSP